MPGQWIIRLVVTCLILVLLLGGCKSQQPAAAGGPTPTPSKLQRLVHSFTDADAHATATAESIPSRTPEPVAWETVHQAAERSAAQLGLLDFHADAEQQIISAINPKDNATYVFVPAGEFLMGSPPTDPAAADNERPLHIVDVGEVWISQTEVTAMQLFVFEREWDHFKRAPADPELPAVAIWDKARRYAKWVGGRLPTEAEWEKACRGTDGRLFPWGDSYPISGTANFAGPSRGPLPVQSYPTDASPYGVYDMAGNVREWVNSVQYGYPYRRDDGRENSANENHVLRGGNFKSASKDLRCALRLGGGKLDEMLTGMMVVAFAPELLINQEQEPTPGFRVVLSPTSADGLARP